MRLPAGLVASDEPLALYLTPGIPPTPGYYPLLPALALAGAHTAFVAEAARTARKELPPLGANLTA